MKITVVNGSPKGSKGNTYKLLEPLFEVIKKKKYELNYIELSSKNIHHCIGCFSCWFKTPGKCVIKDDMGGLLESIKDSDYIFYACPLYVDNLTGLMKNYLDRGIPLAHPKFKRDENGEAVHYKRFENDKKLKIVAISNSGFPELSHFEPLRVIYRRMARNMQADLVGEIYRTQGPLFEASQIYVKMLTWPYLASLKKAYTEIFEDGKISSETQEKLDKLLLPIDKYYENGNSKVEELLEELEEAPEEPYL
ncbi:MAG TPA: flavodoxin family protein [Lentisphaeria bacterium]|nr:MAG: hypothetical protein A2X47_02570 [Lentisphaerae bacterium GWF2_38_69]HBM17022.1 flavodoxin family protein [Lentisphaeria bacterium]